MNIASRSVMKAKLRLKEKAIGFRKRGLSYSEIKKKVPVSKSTLSLWLSDIELTEKQKQRLKELMKIGQPYGSRALKRLRINKTRRIISKAKREVGNINSEEFLYLGAMLYWAEGSKQKTHNPSQRVTFNNSNPLMIKMHLKWLMECLEVKKKDIDFEIYSHSNIKDREAEVIKYWSSTTGFPEAKFGKIYYKKDKKKEYRKNRGGSYHGLLRVNTRKSTDLNRKISGWIEGICARCGVV